MKAIRKTLFTLLICMLLFQFSLFAWYQHFNRANTNLVNKELITEQILLLVQRARQTNTHQIQKIINKSMIPNAVNSIATQPQWDSRITKQSLWNVRKSIINMHKHIKISIRIDKNRWLNFSVNLIPRQPWVQMLVISMSAVVFCLTLLIIWLLFRYTMPLTKIQKAASRLGKNIRAKPMTLHGHKIARDTFLAINDMQQKIKNLLEERTKMLAAISHDLRTPLTRLRLRSTYITNKTQYNKNMKDIDEMENMILQIMDYAHDNMNSTEMNKVDIITLLMAVCNDYFDRNMKVKYEGADQQCLVFGNSVALKRAFSNIIENGLKYANSVVVETRLTNNHIHILFNDDGAGLPQEEISKVFEPFYRTTQANKQKGMGLGLAIVKNIIHNHQGNIKLRNRQQGGLQVAIILPISTSK